MIFAWVIMIAGALAIVWCLIMALRLRKHRFALFGVLTVCGIGMGLILYFVPSLIENWKIVVIITEAGCFVGFGVGIDDSEKSESDGEHPKGCQCYNCCPYEGWRGPGH